MRLLTLVSILALGVAGLSAKAEAACNIRGEFCGYPGWAANAFSHPFDRVPESALDHPTNEWSGERRTYRERKLRSRSRYRERWDD